MALTSCKHVVLRTLVRDFTNIPESRIVLAILNRCNQLT